MRKRTGMGALAACAAAGAALLYAYTLAPSVSAGDSGGLALAAGQAAVPHPPGYPLWVLASSVFVHLPGFSSLGDVAFRTNLFSALCAAAACGALVCVGASLGLSSMASIVSAGLVATTPAVWSFATVTEVYALNLLLLALAALAGLRFREEPGCARAFVFGGSAGLLVMHHQSNVLMLPVLAAVFLVPGDARRAGPVTRSALGGFLLGWTPALWTPLRALLRPDLDWFGAGSLDRLADSWFRGFYGPPAGPERSPELVMDQAAAALHYLQAGFGPALILCGLGLVVLDRTNPRPGLALGGTAVLSLAGSLLILNPVPDAPALYSFQAFWYPAVIAAALLAGFGFDALRRFGADRGIPGLRTPAAAALIALFLVAAPIVRFHPLCDRSGDRVAERYGIDLLSTPPAGAVLLVEGDNEMFLTAYLREERGLRPDLTVIQRKGFVHDDRFGLRGLAGAARDARRDAEEMALVIGNRIPVYAAAIPEWVRREGFTSRREGLLWRIADPRNLGAIGAPRNPWSGYADADGIDATGLDYPTRKCLVAYHQAWAETMTSEGRHEEARDAWRKALVIGHDFPEAAVLVSALAADAERGRR